MEEMGEEMGSHLCILHLRAFFLMWRAVASYQEGVARALRIERAGAWYHVTARGNERRAIYRDQRDRRHFCELLGETVVRFRLVLHAYALMENHFHLLVQTLEPNLGAAMQWLNVQLQRVVQPASQPGGALAAGSLQGADCRAGPVGAYVSVGSAVKRFERHLAKDSVLAEQLRRAREKTEMQNAEM